MLHSRLLKYLDEVARLGSIRKAALRLNVASSVLTGEADLGLSYGASPSPGLRVVASHELSLGAVVSPKHPLTTRHPLRLADCAEFPLAIADASMTIRPAVELAFTRANLPLNATIETNSIEFLKKVARNGHAITFLNPVDVDDEVRAGEIRHLVLPELIQHPIALKLIVRARGGLEAFPNLVVEELRKAMPKLEPIGAA